MLDALVTVGFQIEKRSHAEAILARDFPEAVVDLELVLSRLTIPIEEIIRSGGGETKGTQRLRRGLADRGWQKHRFTIEKKINGVLRESISHEIDHVKSFDGAGTIALEIEWNNKDPFFDRDLENFKRLHAEGAISVGVIVTRGRALQCELKRLVSRWAADNRILDHAGVAAAGLTQTARQRDAVTKRTVRKKNPVPFPDAWCHHFVNDKFGTATTHWDKLADRVTRGVGNPCPLLLIGLPETLVTFGEDPNAVAALIEEGAIDLEEPNDLTEP